MRSGKLVISYSHKDKKYLSPLLASLKLQQQTYDFEIFTDDHIMASEDWAQRIKKEIAEADCAVLLASRAYLGSDFVLNVELPSIREQWETRSLSVLIVWVEDVDVHSSVRRTDAGPALEQLSRIQALNDPTTPLSTLDSTLLTTELISLSRTVAERFPFCSPLKQILRWRPSLRLVATMVLFFAIFIPIAAVVLTMSSRDFNRIRLIQEGIQTIDEGINSGRFRVVRSDDPSTWNIVDVSEGTIIAKDHFEAGTLRFRDFFNESGLVARDEFHYIKGQVTKKTRSYTTSGVVILIDIFTQSSVLVSKKYCPNGEDASCQNFLHEFYSPLPPPVFFTPYR